MTEFAALFAGQQGLLAHLENERRNCLGRMWRWAGILALIAAGGGVLGRVKTGNWVGALLLCVLALVIWAFVAVRQQRRFVGAFKWQVMPELVRAVGPNLDYYPNNCIDLDEFNACGLFIRPDRYDGCDLVAGRVGKTDVRFSLVHAEEEYQEAYTVTDTDSNGDTTSRTEYRTAWRDIFRGLLFSADCNKHFSGATFVSAGKSGFLARRRRSHVQLESPEFSRAFTVHASDQVEARYLLTPNLMERILELRRRANCQLQLSFTGSRVYLAMPMALDAFVPSFWRRIDDSRQLGVWFATLQFIVGIVDDLNLNTRIWSKR